MGAKNAKIKSLSSMGLIALVLVGFTGLVNADENKETPFQVVVVNSIKMPKAEIFANVQSWFSEQKGKSSKSKFQQIIINEEKEDFQSLEVQDKDAGLFVGNGRRFFDVDPVFGLRTAFIYKIRIEIKNNKYKVSITDVVNATSIPFTGGHTPITAYGADKTEKARLEFAEWIKDLQKYLEKNVSNF